MTKADRLAGALDAFLDVSPEVEAAAVVSVDGLPMASALPPHVEEERLAAMAAAILTLGDRASSGLDRGELSHVFVEGQTGHVALMAAGRNAVLVSVTTPDAKVGLVIYEMKRTAGAIEDIMEEPLEDVLDPFGQAGADEPQQQPEGEPDGAPEMQTVRPPEPTPAAEILDSAFHSWDA